jgi:hypothetical protein
MVRSKNAMFETLESRTLMSAATLTADEATLATAVATYSTDKATSITVLAADRAAVKANEPQSDTNVIPLIDTWKQAILTRDNTLLTDRANLKLATNTDKIAILQDRNNIRADKADDNTTQLAIDKTALNSDLVKLATDRMTLGDTLANDIITTKATIAADHEAILAKRLADGASTSSIMAKQQLIDDSIHWVDTLAVDRKAIIADRLVVAQDKHG